jgi:inorganic pyrophosphatase
VPAAAGADRNKYEYDHDREVIRLDRRPFTAAVYPADYRFVVDTLAEEGTARCVGVAR